MGRGANMLCPFPRALEVVVKEEEMEEGWVGLESDVLSVVW